jgi:hypothetical protein
MRNPELMLSIVEDLDDVGAHCVQVGECDLSVEQGGIVVGWIEDYRQCSYPELRLV